MTTNFTITDKARIRLQELIVNNQEAIGVIIHIKSGGCAGYKFQFKYLTKDMVLSSFELLQFNDLTLAVNNESCSLIQGLELDYIEENLGYKFVLNNAKNSCGCGKSFGA